MGYRRTPFAVGEWYHCFNRGIDKRNVFENETDARRFLQLLYLANDVRPIARENYAYLSHTHILGRERTRPLVSIAAYCLMRNHYHIIFQEIVERGISRFMQKVGTGYTMYFNERNARIGNLFLKPFRSKHISTDVYLRKAVQYVHLNPAELIDTSWKKGRVRSLALIEKKLVGYMFSSLPEYLRQPRPENSIVDEDAVATVRRAFSLSKAIRDAQAYYRENAAHMT